VEFHIIEHGAVDVKNKSLSFRHNDN